MTRKIRIACKPILLLSIFFTLAFGTATAQSFANYSGEFPEGVTITYDERVTMRDGVELSTDIYLPEGDGLFPTLLVRDIYTNGSTAVLARPL